MEVLLKKKTKTQQKPTVGSGYQRVFFAASLEQLFMVYAFTIKAFSLRLPQKCTWLTCLWLV